MTQSRKGYDRLAEIINGIRIEKTNRNGNVNLHDIVEQIGYEMENVPGFDRQSFIACSGFVDRLVFPRKS